MKTKIALFTLALILALLIPHILPARDVDGRATPVQTQVISDFAKWHPAGTTIRSDVSYPNPPEEKRFKLFPCFRVACGTPAPRP